MKRNYIIFPGVAVFLTLAMVGLFLLNNSMAPEFELSGVPSAKAMLKRKAIFQPKKTKTVPREKLKTAKYDMDMRPYAAVVEFLIDSSVGKKSITGFSVAARLEQALGDKYRLVERAQISRVMEELKFRSSDLGESSNASEFGRIVGAKCLITGSVIKSGKEYAIAAKIFDLKGQITHKGEITVNSLDSLSGEDFRKLASILTMSRKDKDMAVLCDNLIVKAKKNITAKKYAEAIKSLQSSLDIASRPEAIALLKQARKALSEKEKNVRRVAEYKKTTDTGKQFMEKKELKKALSAFRKSLRMTAPDSPQE